ncbi:MAG: BREX-1 system adenine-specific DNA-methyltransferase PglX [Anaerostipes sp.]|jgi:hypothetical protein
MNKTAIKNFAIDARKKLIASVSDRAGMIGITPEGCSEAVSKGADFEVYETSAGTEITLNKNQCNQRRKLVAEIESRGFEAVVEEVAYTWFNRICAIRFMEVNDYLPTRVRVLSSEKVGKSEPDLITIAPDIEFEFTEKEKEEIIELKMKGTSQASDKLFKKLFIKQCNELHEILPELFEKTEDYTEMLLSLSYTNNDDIVFMLVDKKNGIPEEDFDVTTIDENGETTGQVEIIGWLYQYYNTELKDDTFAKLKKNIKIAKERIPAATQLFTPDWIVRYMVENSVGRLWIDHLKAGAPGTEEKQIAESFGWKYYLPEAEQNVDVKIQLAEAQGAVKSLKPTDIRCIDPCMGSGHVLIAMFDILMDIYKSVGYSAREAALEIVENNIYGLDIDKRAYQLAYFAIMMKGRGFNRRFFNGRHNAHICPNMYQVQESGYTDAEGNKYHVFDLDALNYFTNCDVQLEKDMNILKEVMFDAREYGSIIKIPEIDFDKIFHRFKEIEDDISIFKLPALNGLYPFVNSAYLLYRQYDAVVTNPPYMGSSGMGLKLSKYVQNNYPDSKSDLFAVFIEKCNSITMKNRYQAMITQHAWMFLSSYGKLRNKLLQYDTVNMAHLGARAFEEIGGEVVQTTSFVIRKNHINRYKGVYCRLIEPSTQKGKEEMFIAGKNHYESLQEDYLKIPGSPIAYWVGKSLLNVFNSSVPLKNISSVKTGIQTGGNELFVRQWHEVNFGKIGRGFSRYEQIKESKRKWYPYNKGGDFRKWYGNNFYVVNMENNGTAIKRHSNNYRLRDSEIYFKPSITWSFISSNKFGVRYCPNGFLFDVAGSSVLPEENIIFYLMGFLTSIVAFAYLLIQNPTLNYQVDDISNLPIIISEKERNSIYIKVEDNILFSKTDWDSFETSWDFTTHPLVISQKERQEQLSYNMKSQERVRSVSLVEERYKMWNIECNQRFEQLKENEEELNRIFIDIYGLQDELTPDVEDKDVTVRKADLQRDIKSLLSYAVGCILGRYSLDTEGLAYAGGEWDSNKYSCFIPDADNIIPITDEEYFEDDIVGLFCKWLQQVYGEETLEENLDFIANALGNKGNSSREIIRNYFLKDFFKDHCKTYQKRPIYWLFDSGKQNGFKALVYLHRYDADTVGRVRTDYLHKEQSYVEAALRSAEYTIVNSSSASEKSKATKAVSKYTKQLAEMKIYDEAIAHIANQRIELDLDDGVKVNYEKFQGVEVSREGQKSLKVNLLAKIK